MSISGDTKVKGVGFEEDSSVRILATQPCHGLEGEEPCGEANCRWEPDTRECVPDEYNIPTKVSSVPDPVSHITDKLIIAMFEDSDKVDTHGKILKRLLDNSEAHYINDIKTRLELVINDINETGETYVDRDAKLLRVHLPLLQKLLENLEKTATVLSRIAEGQVNFDEYPSDIRLSDPQVAQPLTRLAASASGSRSKHKQPRDDSAIHTEEHPDQRWHRPRTFFGGRTGFQGRAWRGLGLYYGGGAPKKRTPKKRTPKKRTPKTRRPKTRRPKTRTPKTRRTNKRRNR